jgi:hypothetical protein
MQQAPQLSVQACHSMTSVFASVMHPAPDVTYYPVLADTQALESLLKEQGYKDLHLAPYLYLVNQSRSCMEVSAFSTDTFLTLGEGQRCLCAPYHPLLPLLTTAFLHVYVPSPR